MELCILRWPIEKLVTICTEDPIQFEIDAISFLFGFVIYVGLPSQTGKGVVLRISSESFAEMK